MMIFCRATAAKHLSNHNKKDIFKLKLKKKILKIFKKY